MPSLDDALSAELRTLGENPLYSEPGILEGSSSNRSIINGKKIVVLCSNNYHALTTHPKVISRVKQALDVYGSGLGSGRALASMKIQLELEQKISEFKQTQATLTFQTGYDTNLATVWALTNSSDVCICDEYNHASIFDGIKLSGAKEVVYPHLDLERLEDSLHKSQDARRVFVITPSVFPLEGDIAPLRRIVELSEKYSAMVYVDDSHAVGVLGKRGTGGVEHSDLHGKMEIQVGTLSKALASVGGYVTGSSALREYLFRKARPFAQATGHVAPPSAAAVIAAIEILQEEPSFIERLWNNTQYFRESIRALGFDTGQSETPIVPVIIGDESKAAQFRNLLYDEGIFVQAFGYPALPKGRAKLRTILSSAHTREDLDLALNAFEKVGKKTGVI